MIYELRIYRCMPGRLPALLFCFQNHTIRIWEKHGIRQAGFWTTLIGKSSQEITYHARLGQHGRAREALAGFFDRSRMDRGCSRHPEGRPARREHQQPVAGASGVLCREVRLCPSQTEASMRVMNRISVIVLGAYLVLAAFQSIAQAQGKKGSMEHPT